jgi:hypothetical protein
MYIGYLSLLSDEELRTPYKLQHDEAVIIWRDVMHLALLDLEKEAYRVKTAEWFISNKYEVGSFLWVCDVFDFDPVVIRRKLGKKIYFLLSAYGTNVTRMV